MESLLHRHSNHPPSIPQLSVTPPFMPSTDEVFSFVDLPFTFNSTMNPLSDYSTNLDLLFPPMPPTLQEPLMSAPPSSIPIPNGNPLNVASTSSKKRGSRKRSRSSQRAPTTVMVTNRCNFRAMVQEYTGVPGSHYSSLQLPGSQSGVFGATPGSSALFSNDFDRQFPALSSLLVLERGGPTYLGEMIPRRAT